ncbi:MAG: hypothetical protein OXF64_00975, partial [bacterium]|nr:hypothetical protein [bacterium]
MRRFSKGQLAGTLFGLAFLGLVAYSAVSSIPSTDRGAESAEKAVQELLDALSREDVLAVIGVMAPFEVGSSADLYPDIVDLAAAAGAIQSTDWLAGMDFAAEEIEMRSTLLHPDVAMVSMVSGRFEMNLDDSVADPALAELGGLRASLTVQEALGDIDDAMRRANRALEEVGISPFRLRAPDELFVMTVRRDGRWYVSASYTAAEYARQSLDLPAADFTASREDAPAGADSPSDVITDMVAVVNSRSLGEHWEALLADDPGGYFAPFDVLSPPDELGVFMDYTPAMEAFSQRLGEQMGVDASVFGNTAQIAGELFDVDGTVALDVSVREEPIGDNAVALHLESVSMQVDAELTDLSLGEVLYLCLDVDWTGLCL